MAFQVPMPVPSLISPLRMSTAPRNPGGWADTSRMLTESSGRAEPKRSAPVGRFGFGVASATTGTASRVRGWVLLEQPGPWGREAVLESQLEASLEGSLVVWMDGSIVSFNRRFVDKGRYREYLSAVPIYVITHPGNPRFHAVQIFLGFLNDN